MHRGSEGPVPATDLESFLHSVRSLLCSVSGLGPGAPRWEGERSPGGAAPGRRAGISVCLLALFHTVFWLLLVVPDVPQPSQCPMPSPRGTLVGVLKRHHILRTLSFHLLVAVLTSVQRIGSLCRESSASLAEVSGGSAQPSRLCRQPASPGDRLWYQAGYWSAHGSAFESWKMSNRSLPLSTVRLLPSRAGEGGMTPTSQVLAGYTCDPGKPQHPQVTHLGYQRQLLKS